MTMLRSRRMPMAALISAALWSTGCSTDRAPGDFYAPSDVGTLVVDAVLQVGKPAPNVILSRTISPDQDFFRNLTAEVGASVRVEAPGQQLFVYQPGAVAGVYEPSFIGGSPIIQPNLTYNLQVTASNGEVVRATTTTPPVLDIDTWLLLDQTGQNVRRILQTFDTEGDSVYFHPDNQLVYSDGLLEAQFTPVGVAAYQVGLFSLDWDSDFVIDPDFFDDEDFEDLERYISSPLFEAIDGKIRLPWFAIYYAERYKFRIYAVDRNWFDLVRSTPEFSAGGAGFGGNLGDDFERPIFHVEGGIGLFGSGSADSVGVFILPRP